MRSESFEVNWQDINSKKDPLVTILTVTYNSEKTVARTIESVLHQTYKNIDYLVIDGKSSDGTVCIAEDFFRKFEELGIQYRVISEADNGMYDALNKGAALGHGILVGQINSDDWYEDDAVEEMVKLWKKTNFDMAYADIRMVNPDGTNWVKKSRIDKFVNTRHWNHPTQFTRRELLLNHPYPCECMSDDLDLLLWIRSTDKHVEVLKRVTANFTVEGMSHSKDWKTIQNRINTKNRIYKRYGYSFLHTIDITVVEAAKYLLEYKKGLKTLS